MFYQSLVVHCAPTLAGIKTGNLFSCNISSESLHSYVRELNAVLVTRNIRLIVMKCDNPYSLIYMYRPDFLKKDLSDALAKNLLTKLGYPLPNIAHCVAELGHRLRYSSEFPHEIGLFLGYPSVDVNGFIQNKAQGSKCTGAWKVYGDVEASQKKFELYKNCTTCYLNSFQVHHSIDKLAIAVS